MLFIGIAFAYSLYKAKKNVDDFAVIKWDAEEETVFVEYGNHLIPFLVSQLPAWNALPNTEKFAMLDLLKKQVKQGKLTTIKENGLTKFVGITEKGKDIKFHAKKRTDEWKN